MMGTRLGFRVLRAPTPEHRPGDEEWEFCTSVVDTNGETESEKACLDRNFDRAYAWARDTRDWGALS